ncbi:unnamed protein product [Urochloa decumbens]|uniref:Uncharacterized protein n=1 Tax=Urochloa decumbens TaxID=240449 RepID=A0ABC9E2A4_9POAL
MEMETLTEVVQSTKQIKIQGFSVTSAMSNGESFKSRRWTVGGYDWEVQVVPRLSNGSRDYVALNLRFHSEAPTDNNVKASNFSCRFIDPSGKLKPSQGSSGTYKFTRGSYTFNIMARADLQASGYIKDDAFTVECTIMVLRELAESAVTHRPANDLVPSSGLHHHLGELLQKGTGSDVTLVVSGESFTAHKAILASRSPVFMAEFFGHMKEKRSQRVEIKGMESATTLALAEQHGCSHLKAKCIKLIVANLEAVMATEGYKHLMASCPSVMNDLLKAVHGRKN